MWRVQKTEVSGTIYLHRQQKGPCLARSSCTSGCSSRPHCRGSPSLCGRLAPPLRRSSLLGRRLRLKVLGLFLGCKFELKSLGFVGFWLEVMGAGLASHGGRGKLRLEDFAPNPLKKKWCVRNVVELQPRLRAPNCGCSEARCLDSQVSSARDAKRSP